MGRLSPLKPLGTVRFLEPLDSCLGNHTGCECQLTWERELPWPGSVWHTVERTKRSRDRKGLELVAEETCATLASQNLGATQVPNTDTITNWRGHGQGFNSLDEHLMPRQRGWGNKGPYTPVRRLVAHTPEPDSLLRTPMFTRDGASRSSLALPQPDGKDA